MNNDLNDLYNSNEDQNDNMQVNNNSVEEQQTEVPMETQAENIPVENPVNIPEPVKEEESVSATAEQKTPKEEPQPTKDDYNGNKSGKKNLKNILISVGCFAVVFIIVFSLMNGCVGGGSHSNTTGFTNYKGSDVSYNCVLEKEENNKKTVVHSDILFNFSNTQVIIYNKAEVTYLNGLTDEVYKDYLKELSPTACGPFSDVDCTKSQVDLSITSLGWDTKVTRNNNIVTVTYYNPYGAGQKASNSDKKELLKAYTDNGCKCK